MNPIILTLEPTEVKALSVVLRENTTHRLTPILIDKVDAALANHVEKMGAPTPVVLADLAMNVSILNTQVDHLIKARNVLTDGPLSKRRKCKGKCSH